MKDNESFTGKSFSHFTFVHFLAAGAEALVALDFTDSFLGSGVALAEFFGANSGLPVAYLAASFTGVTIEWFTSGFFTTTGAAV